MINTKANHEWRVVLFDHFSTGRGESSLLSGVACKTGHLKFGLSDLFNHDRISSPHSLVPCSGVASGVHVAGFFVYPIACHSIYVSLHCHNQ